MSTTTPRWLVIICALAIGGCGTPAGLDRATAQFSEAATVSENALADLDKAVSMRLTRQRRADAVNGQVVIEGDPNRTIRTLVVKKRKVATATGDEVSEKELRLCALDSRGCELYLQYGPNGPILPIVVDTANPKLRLISTEIELYAQGLAAVAAADETTKVKEGFDKAMAAVCGLAGVVQPGTTLACQTFSKPLSSLVALAYGEYQEQVKLAALQDATSAMNPVVRAAASLFSGATEFAALAEIVDLEEEVSTAQRTWTRSRTDANLDAFLRAAEKLDKSLTATRAEVFVALANSHDKLTRTLTRDGQGIAELLEDLRTLVDKAKKLQAVAKEFRSAAEELSAE